MSAFNIDQSQVEEIQNITALYCATDDFPLCYGLCPNPDLAGIGESGCEFLLHYKHVNSPELGVRVAFYSQSLMNGMLFAISVDGT